MTMALNIAALTVEDAAPPKTSAEDNPAVAWLRDSYSRSQWRQVTVTADEAKTVHAMLLSASRTLDLGVKVRLVNGDNEVSVSKAVWDEVKKLGKRKITVKFLGKVRTERPRKPVVSTAE